MKKVFCFAIILLTVLTMRAAGQQPPSQSKVDLIRKSMPGLTGEKRLKAYENMVNEAEWSGEVNTVLGLCDEWIQYAQKEGNLSHEESARNKRLTLIYNSEDWLRLEKEAREQKDWMEKHERWNSFYKAWRDIIESCSYTSRTQTALREAEQMQEYAQQQGNTLGRALACQEIGVIYDNIDHHQSVKALDRSIRLMKEIPDEAQNELLSAYFYLAQELDQIKDYSRELVICKEWRQHLNHIKALEKPEAGKMNVYDMEQHLWYASALIGSDSLAAAARELAACEQLNEQIKDPYLTYQMQVHQARLAMKEGDIKKAVAFTDLYAPMMDLDWWPMAQRQRGEILLAAGRDHEAALLYQKMYHHKDSTFSKDVRIQLDELNTLFQVDELRMKGQLERSRFVIFTVVLILLARLLFMYFRHQEAKRLAQKNQELTIANARAEESSRMKTDFIQQISHEFRTPLNILNGFTQILTAPDMVLQDEEKADIQRRISESTERITSLVNKMLELSDANSQQVIDRSDRIAALVIASQAADNAGIEQASHIKFHLETDAQAETVVHTNLRAATRALTQLLDNARKFTKEGEVRLRIQVQPETIDFIVEDTGIGIPAKEAEHIFDEFVQLDEYYDGTGIGLAVARSIARRLGGDIVLDTSYSGGARFIMSLPKE